MAISVFSYEILLCHHSSEIKRLNIFVVQFEALNTIGSAFNTALFI